MGKKFSLNKSNNEASLSEKFDKVENKKIFDIRFIEPEKIIPNEKNFYKLSKIEELADNIEEFGLSQNFEVLEQEDEEGNKTYKLIGGHRRFEAIKLLIAKGDTRFSKIPCKVDVDLSDLDERLRLLASNKDTRELTPQDKRLQIQELTRLYELKKQISGEKINVKKEVAEVTGNYGKTVERYSNINNKLIPDLQKFFDDKKITYTEAYNWATLDEQAQLAILDVLQSQDKISKDEVKAIKEANKKLAEENEIKSKELEEKESKIASLKNEKAELEQEQSDYQIEQEVLEEEKKKLEAKIREEMAQLTEEELNNVKEQLEEANEKAQLLESKKIELDNKLAEKDKAIADYKEKLTEIKEPVQVNSLTQEQLNKAIAKSKINEAKTSMVKELNEISKLAESEKLVEEADILIDDIEKALKSLKSRMEKTKKKLSEK